MSSATNSSDLGWQYGYLAPQPKTKNKNKKKTNNIICNLCGKVTSGGLSRFKKHIAHIKGDVAPCPNSTEEAKKIVSEHLELMEKQKLENKDAEPADELLNPKPKSKASRESIKRSKNKRSEENNSSSEDEIIPQKRRNRRTSGRSKDNKMIDTHVFEPFLEDLWSKIPEEKRGSFAYFDSLWFKMYKEEQTKTKVLEWIKNKEIFSKKYVFVPIVCWSHWSLLILCNFGESNPCMLLLDSLFDNDPNGLGPDIRRFIMDIYRSEGREENKKDMNKIPLLIPKVPQQTNGEECGAFVLYFIYHFLQNAPNDFNLQDYPYFLTEDWFTYDDFKNFGKEIESFSLSKKKSEDESKEMLDNDNGSSDECEIVDLD
ncbi:hypothetical protein LUZ60_001844 [Juncus effusus]|nr:hypothetical protein LUZ60_001844 [Juncus effusus]